MQGKHSRISGNRPNLMPGEFGVNLADKLLFLRGKGRVISVPMEQVAAMSAPPKGFLGAPLTFDAQGKAVIDEAMAPAALVDGKYHVDPVLGVGEYGVPGVSLVPAAPGLFSVGADVLLIERFYVASEGLRLSEVAFHSQGGGGMIRFGLAQDDGVFLTISTQTNPPAGLVTAALNHPLAVGWHRLYLWTSGGLTLKQLRALRPSEPIDLTTATPMFTQRTYGPPGDYTVANLPPMLIQSSDTAPTPGDLRCMVLRWTLA